MSETNPPEQLPIEEPICDEGREFWPLEPGRAQDVLQDEDLANAQAHCPHCLEPITQADYYCPKCAKPVGQLTAALPLISVPFEAQFLGGMWRTIWSDKAGWALRVFCAVLVVALAPILVLIGLPVVLWQRVTADRRKRNESRT